MRVFLNALILTVLVPAFAAPALAADCEPPAIDGEVIFMDAHTGRIDGATAFQKSESVYVVVRHKNPFKYDYKLTIDAKEVEEPGLARFIEIARLNPALPAEEKGPQSLIADTLPSCTADQLAAIRIPHEQLGTLRRALETDMPAAVTAHNAFAAAFEAQQKILQSDVTADRLCAAARALVGLNDSYKPPIEDLTKRANELLGLANAQTVLVRTMKASCKAPPDIFDNARDRAFAIASAFVPEVQKKLSDIATAKTAATSAAGDVKKILQSDNAFYEMHRIGRYALPTNVALKLERKDRGATSGFSTLQTTTVNFGGGQKFILAGGIAGTNMDRHRFARVDGFERGRDGTLVLVDGKPVLTTVIGREEDSAGGVSPIVLLHGSIIETQTFVDSIGWSLGLTAHIADQIDIEYLTGPSFGFVDNRFILTIGAYRAQTQQLDGDFYVGAKLPETVTEIPITRHGEWGIGFAVAVKIR